MILLSACSPRQAPTSKVRLTLDRGASGELNSLPGLTDSYCYALNITGDKDPIRPANPSGGSCTVGSSDLGMTKGLYKLGDTAEVSVPTGTVRFDLLAFPKVGDCSGTFSLRSTGAGKFLATLNGTESTTEALLAATKVANVVSGDQTLALDLQRDNAGVVGIPYACVGAMTLVNATMIDASTLEITGSGLDKAASVAIAPTSGASTTLSILAKTANYIRVQSSTLLTFTLGTVYNLIVTDAYGSQTTLAVNFQIAAGSITPAMLSGSGTWPFVGGTRLALPAQGTLVIHGSSTVTDWTLAGDRNLATMASIVIPANLTKKRRGPHAKIGGASVVRIDLGSKVPGFVTVQGQIFVGADETTGSSCQLNAHNDPALGEFGSSVASFSLPWNGTDYDDGTVESGRMSIFHRYLTLWCDNYSATETRDFKLHELTVQADTFP